MRMVPLGGLRIPRVRMFWPLSSYRKQIAAVPWTVGFRPSVEEGLLLFRMFVYLGVVLLSSRALSRARPKPTGTTYPTCIG